MLLAFSVVLAIASLVRADIGVIVAEPVSALGFFTRVGHVGTYPSNICPDGSPIRMRACRARESGVVVIRSSTLSENEDYDWAIVSFEEYLHGFASPDLAPLIGTRKLQKAIEGHDFIAVFSGAMTTTAGAVPKGQAKGIFDLVLPHATGDRTSGVTMQTPKGLAKAFVSREWTGNSGRWFEGSAGGSPFARNCDGLSTGSPSTGGV